MTPGIMFTDLPEYLNDDVVVQLIGFNSNMNTQLYINKTPIIFQLSDSIITNMQTIFTGTL
jgi:hypothetical protein